MATILSDIARYGKIDRSGTILTALGDKFSPPATDKYVRAALAVQGSKLRWALYLNVYDATPAFTNSILRYARTDLSGVIEVAAADVTGTSLTVQGEDVRIGTDSDGNSHIFYKIKPTAAFQVNAFQTDAFQQDAPVPMKWVKVDTSGTVLAGPSQVLSPPDGIADVSPAGVWVGTDDAVHVIGYSLIGQGLTLSYGRMTKAGVVVVEMSPFVALPTGVTFTSVAYASANNQFLVGLATTTAILQARLDPVDPTSESLESSLLKVSL